ncbi:ROK family protein [Agromyces sp. NPDC056965]|uniref:ROK family transcriptional regulator n=1 Tax=Agromyces sp. NPDC056965 TaxID=3345983 RepID=UPI003644A156
MTSLRGTDLAAMRRLNGRAVLTALWETEDARTVSQLAHETDLSRPTVEAALADLVTAGLVQVDSPRTTGAGRPARGYRFAADRGVVVGLDVGPHGITGMVGDLRGRELHRQHLDDLDLQDGSAALAAVTSTIDHLLASTPHTHADVAAITVAVPGIVGVDGELVLTTVVPDWLESGLPARVRAAYPQAAVTFDNDTKLAALAEIRLGTVGPGETAIVLQAGYRISAATIVEGRVTRGAHGAAGEIGALERLGWSSAYERLEHSSSPYGSPRQLFTAANTGDADAISIVQSFTTDISDGLGALVLAVDPHAVVVGGGISGVGEVLVASLAENLAARSLFPPELRTSRLGAAAPCHGALVRAADHVRALELSA